MKKYTQPKASEPEVCDKRSYSFREAHELINRAHSNSRPQTKCRKKIPHRAYHCEICHTWHLTSKRYDNHKNEN